jgi:hypothetical protein
VVSPQPEPPSIIADLLSAVADAEGGITLLGAAGAVTPGGSTLITLDLDSKAPATSINVAGDGSFSLPLLGGLMDAYRLQAFSSGLRSDPLDITGQANLTGDPAVAPTTRPLASCFFLEPELEIGPLAASTSATVLMINTCASAVTVSGITLRAASPAFTLAPAGGALVMPPQSTSAFTVTFDPHPGDPTEDIVFVQISAPQSGRLPLTVRGQAP